MTDEHGDQDSLDITGWDGVGWAAGATAVLSRVQQALPWLLEGVVRQQPHPAAVTAAAARALRDAATELEALAPPPPELLDANVGELGLSTRPYNVLARHGISTIRALVELDEEQVRRMRNMTSENVEEITTALRRRKLCLAGHMTGD